MWEIGRFFLRQKSETKGVDNFTGESWGKEKPPDKTLISSDLSGLHMGSKACKQEGSQEPHDIPWKGNENKGADGEAFKHQRLQSDEATRM